MMPYLKNLSADVAVQHFFYFFFRVAGKQEFYLTAIQSDHHRVIINVIPGFTAGEDLQLNLAETISLMIIMRSCASLNSYTLGVLVV